MYPFARLPGLRAFVLASGPFSVCLAGILLVRLSCHFVRSYVMLSVHCFRSFVRFLAIYSASWPSVSLHVNDYSLTHK